MLCLTHWGRVTHICVGKLTITGSDNGLSPGRRQAIIWTNTGIISIRPLGTKFSEILSEIQAFSFRKMHVNMSSAKRRPFCLGLNVLIQLHTWWMRVHRRWRSCYFSCFWNSLKNCHNNQGWENAHLNCLKLSHLTSGKCCIYPNNVILEHILAWKSPAFMFHCL